MHCELLTLHNILMEFYKYIMNMHVTVYLNVESLAGLHASYCQHVLVTMWVLSIYEHEAWGPSC